MLFLEDEKMNWIKTSERLPEETKEVLVYLDSECEIYKAFFEDKRWHLPVQGLVCKKDYFDFWYPFPEFPKEQK
jgi:hypothetical protein